MENITIDTAGNRIFIVVSQTGTMLSRVLKLLTGAKYNHVSISTDPTLSTMYSFGRKHAYNPFVGGFVIESPHFGTFKRFHETEAIVLSITLPEERIREISDTLAEMYENRSEYRYNTAGLFLAGLRIHYQKKNSYYCSEFAKDFLAQFELISPETIGRIPKPVEFLQIRGADVVYSGKLRLYDTPEKLPHTV